MDNSKYPVLGQIKSILSAGISKPRFTDFTASSMSAWALFAKEATACGSNLTMECVISKASAETNWDAGGLYAPASLDPVHPQVNKCWLLINLTTQRLAVRPEGHQPDPGSHSTATRRT